MSSFAHPASPRELLRNARRVARLTRGRDDFVWRRRVLPIGLPLGVALGAAASQRRRDRPAAAFIAALAGIVALSYAEALIEWETERRRYVRSRD
jgi:hypothetical protein